MNSHRISKCRVLLFSLAELFVVGGGAICAQSSATISSNVDQTASITSHGASSNRTLGSGPVALPEDFSKLRLAPGFVLQMSVFGAPELNQALPVDAVGDVSVPLIGRVHVLGETLREAETQIASELLDQQMLINPHVALEITAFSQHPVLVAGEVQQPGKIQLLAPRPVLDVIAQAGGVTTAAGGDIEVRHSEPGAADTITHVAYTNGKTPEGASNVLVAPGDTVYVRRAGVVYVLGAVQRPGGYLMVNGGALTLTQAVALAFGPTPVASTGTAFVVRSENGTLSQIPVALKDSERGRTNPFSLQDGDMVYVPTSKLKSALINSSTILSSAASAAIYTIRP